MNEAKVYAFRVGTPDYARRIAGPFDSQEAVQDAASHYRADGERIGRIRRVTPDEFSEARDALSRGILTAGW